MYEDEEQERYEKDRAKQRQAEDYVVCQLSEKYGVPLHFRDLPKYNLYDAEFNKFFLEVKWRNPYYYDTREWYIEFAKIRDLRQLAKPSIIAIVCCKAIQYYLATQISLKNPFIKERPRTYMAAEKKNTPLVKWERAIYINERILQ